MLKAKRSKSPVPMASAAFPEKGQPSEREGHGYIPHETPVAEVVDDTVPVMMVPGEKGYFPTGKVTGDPLVSCGPKARLYQMHPKYQTSKRLSTKLASGTLELRDPSDGTPSEVAFVATCGDVAFYVKSDDVSRKISPTDFILMLPDDCIGVDLAEALSSADALRNFEALLDARMSFRDDSDTEDANMRDGACAGEVKDILPDNRVSRSIYGMSKWLSKKIVHASESGSRKVESYGQSKRDGVNETREVSVSNSSIKMAEGVRQVSEKTNQMAVTVTGKISNALGNTVGKHVVAKDGDGAVKRRGRSLLLSSSIAYAEVADGIGEGYDIMVRAAKDETTSFVAKKYGKDAAELARHTAGASVNFGSAALTMRRVVNVKKVLRSSAKKAAINGIKQSIKG